MKRLICAVAFCVACLAGARADEKVDLADQQIQAFVKRCEAATRSEIAELPEKIKKSEVLLRIVKRGAINPQLAAEKWIGDGPTAKVAFPSSEHKKKAEQSAQFMLDARRVRLKDLKAGDALAMPFLSYDNLKVGDIGRPEYGFNVNQIVDESNVIVKYVGETDLWLKGFDTKDLTDDSRINSVDCVRITGTKKYTTVTGASRTILLAEPFDGDAVIRAHIAAHKAAKPMPMKPAK
jgi:hypothetical protein